MAIAVKLDQDTRRTSVLDITADKMYNETLRPMMQDMLIRCKTDPEVTRTLDKIMNALDGFLKENTVDSLSNANETIQPALKVLMADTYYRDGALRRASDEEVKTVKEFAQKLSDLSMLLRIEIDNHEPEPEEQPKERIDYITPHGVGTAGENNEWKTHNIKTLNEPHPAKRLPNL